VQQILRRKAMNFFGIGISSLVAAIIAIVFGIIMIAKPRIVAYLIGAYLLYIGIMFLIQTYIL
jgi:predicted tellurium resistance membrane protein TerC